MQIQIALDRIPRAEAVRVAALTAPYADIIEVGTSLIKAYGMPIVTEIADITGKPPTTPERNSPWPTTPEQRPRPFWGWCRSRP